MTSQRVPDFQASIGWCGIAMDTMGNVFIADVDSHRILKVGRDQTVISVAGSGKPGMSGDGKRATSAQLRGPRGIATDRNGNLYIADSANHRIRKVTTDGTIATIAGTGTPGFSGDNGPAVSAQLNDPRSLAVDDQGNVFIADTNNQRIRKVDPAGVIRTIAGNGVVGFGGDGGPAINAYVNFPRIALDGLGNLFIADIQNHRVRKVSPDGMITTVAGVGGPRSGGDGGPAASAGLNLPFAVSPDSAGNLLIADRDNGRIRKVTPAGIISTVVGGPPAEIAITGLYGPGGIAQDGTGSVLIADSFHHRIAKVEANGTVTTLVGNKTIVPAYGVNVAAAGNAVVLTRLQNPTDVAIDEAGNLFIADAGNHRIQKVERDGTTRTIAGVFSSDNKSTAGFGGDGGPANLALLKSPSAIAVAPQGNLYIADTGNHRIRKINSSGVISTVAGTGIEGFSGDNGPAVLAQLNLPTGLAVDQAGNLFFADTRNHRIRKITPSGTITTVAGNGKEGFGGDGGRAVSARLRLPYDIAFDSAGSLFIADSGNSIVRKVSLDGTIITVAGRKSEAGAFLKGLLKPLVIPAAILLGPDILLSRREISRKDGGPATDAELAFPKGLLVDGEGNLFIADSGDSRIRKVENIRPPTRR